jgi:hypothetical protein
VLAVELQIETAQRLPRPVDDLLHREIGAALLDDDRLRGVEEPLNALSGPQLRRLDGAFDRALLPGGLFARARHGQPGIGLSRENMDELYRRKLGHRAPGPPPDEGV